MTSWRSCSHSGKRRPISDAIQSYENCLALKPDEFYATYNLGNAYYTQKKYAKSATCILTGQEFLFIQTSLNLRLYPRSASVPFSKTECRSNFDMKLCTPANF